MRQATETSLIFNKFGHVKPVDLQIVRNADFRVFVTEFKAKLLGLPPKNGPSFELGLVP